MVLGQAKLLAARQGFRDPGQPGYGLVMVACLSEATRQVGTPERELDQPRLSADGLPEQKRPTSCGNDAGLSRLNSRRA